MGFSDISLDIINTLIWDLPDPYTSTIIFIKSLLYWTPQSIQLVHWLLKRSSSTYQMKKLINRPYPLMDHWQKILLRSTRYQAPVTIVVHQIHVRTDCDISPQEICQSRKECKLKSELAEGGDTKDGHLTSNTYAIYLGHASLLERTWNMYLLVFVSSY